MNMNIYAVYDAAVGAYMNPFVAQRDAVAIRAFGDVVNQSGHPFHEHPADYHLFRLGSWDSQTGELVGSAPAPVIPALGLLTIAEEKQEEVANVQS